jgi:hypothetical protein
MDFAAGVYLSEAQNLIPQKASGQQSTKKLGRKYQHDWLYLDCISSQ